MRFKLILLTLLIFSSFIFPPNARKVFAQTVPTTVTYQVSTAQDDVNQVDANFDPNAATLFLGTSGSPTGSYTGLRFSNLAIPTNATITSAYFQVYSNSSQWITIGYDIYADASGNSPAFSLVNRPSDRILSNAKVSHSSDAQWLANTWYSSDDLSPVIQEIVNRIDWQTGSNLSIILTGTTGTYGNKTAFSFDGTPAFAPKLVITYQNPSGLPGPVISQVNATGITINSANISWNTNVASDSQVEYGTTMAYGNTTTLDPTVVTSHSKSLSNLSSNLLYHYRVKSRGLNGVLAASPDSTFTTLPDTSPNLVGQWSGVLNWPLVAVHMALMPTGKVLMWDAWEYGQTPSARLWDPNSQIFTSVPNTTTGLFCSAQAMLPDGRQLVIGGHNGEGVGIKNTNIFDYNSSSWSRVSDLNSARWYPSAATLSDGRVLTVGGTIANGVNASIPEIFSTTTNSWTQLPGGDLNVGEYPNIYQAPNGKVFMVSGEGDFGNGVSDNVSRYFDVNTQAWQSLGVAPVSTGTTVMYQPGKILATGGSGVVDSKSAVIDLTQPTPTWRVTTPMNYARFLQSLVVLPDGKVFMAGGSDTFSLSSVTGILQSEMWSPATETWTTLVPEQNLRLYHSTGLLLPDGRVLIAGGGRLSPANDYLTAEIYSPAYLFKGARPTISSSPAAATYAANISVSSPDAPNIVLVSLVRLSSVTHDFNMDQRFVPLSFTKNANSLSIQTPNNPNIAPPGYYMLFILNNQGVPSVASMIQLTSTQASFTPTPTIIVPTATPTTVPTATPTPALPTSTPTPTPTPSGTLTLVINSSGDDANQDGTSLSLNGLAFWTGSGASPSASYSGLRFTNTTLPKGAIITSATLQLFSAQAQWLNNNFFMAAENIGNSPAFSSSNKLSTRTLTVNKISHADDVNWALNTWYTLNDISPVIQEVINRADWQAGNSLSIILKGTGSAYSRKFVSSYDGSSTHAPRLVITYH